jgi:hypothetical protein
MSSNPSTCNNFYARSDWIFSCKTKLFFEIFENVYDDILNKYIDREKVYLPIHFQNLKSTLEDNLHHVRWHWLNYPAKYFSVQTLNDGPLSVITNNLTQLNSEKFDVNTPVITHPVSLQQRQNRPLSTEKFIILFVLQKTPIKHFTFEMKMPLPQERNRWKLK